MKLLVAINPHSGGGKGSEIGAKVRAFLDISNHQVDYVETNSLAKTLELVNAECSAKDFDVLVCVGGDGFVHDLLPTLMRFQLALLVIPAGTGNDFARTLGLYGSDIQVLLGSLEKSSSSSIDIALISHDGIQTPFVQILSTGFDSVVNERANNFKRVRGSIKYAIAVLLEVWKFKAVTFEISIDGVDLSQRATLVCIANGISYGAGMKILPSAKNNDGVLDVLILDQVHPLRLLLVFPRVFIGAHIGHPKVHLYSGKHIKISGDTSAFADGEKVSHLPIEVTISEVQLQVYRS